MWMNLLESSQALKSIFNDEPVLKDVILHEVSFRDNGASLFLKIDLNEYPKKQPKKWEISKFNTVQLTLEFWEIDKLIMENWETTNLVNIQLLLVDEKINLSINGSISLKCNADIFSIGKISAYQNSE